MITETVNAAASMAMREAVPKAVWRRAYEAAERREKAIVAFAHHVAKPEQLFQALESSL